MEILVHASAPSKGADDARYRAFAKAYLAFQPAKRVELLESVDGPSSSPGDETIEADQPGSQLQDELFRSSLAAKHRGYQDDKLREDDDDSYRTSQPQSQEVAGSKRYITRSILKSTQLLHSPQASFQSILDNRNSPLFRRPIPPRNISRDEVSLTSEKSLQHTPPSIILDSQSTFNRAIPELSSPTRLLEIYLQNLETTPSVSPSEDSTPEMTRKRRRLATPKSVTPSSRSTHLCSDPQAISPILPPLLRKPMPSIEPASQDANFNSGFSRSFLPSESVSRRPIAAKLFSSAIPRPPFIASVLSSPADAARVGCIGASLKVDILSAPPPSDNQISISSTAQPRDPSSAYLFELPKHRSKLKSRASSNSNEIHPPPPSTSITTDNISASSPLVLSSSLSMLATQLSFSRFKPASQTRDLRPLERGYWSVDVSSWAVHEGDLPSREKTWRFLRNYIEAGKAGWGVWCWRDAAREGDVKGKGKAVVSAEEAWRIYCWGAVVPHIYLLLWLASERRIKGIGAEWVDGSGEVVITMPKAPG